MPDKLPEQLKTRITRRQFVPGAAAALAALGVGGVVGYEARGGSTENGSTENSADANPAATTPAATAPAAPATASAQVESFLTRPDLRPPRIRITDMIAPTAADRSPRFVVLAPISAVHAPDQQNGPMIIDRQGRLVWFQPTSGQTFDARVQTYNGKPVLTWWEGELVSSHGSGVGRIVDSSYRVLHSIRGSKNLKTDLHELELTSKGTVLVSAYEEVSSDLSGAGGSRNGKVWNCHVLEIDPTTGKVLFDWDSLKHVPVSESYLGAHPNPQVYDYFHLNSISELPNGNLLVSGRNTWTLYEVDRASGNVVARIGGKRSDYKIDADARFAWQHHTRVPRDSVLTIFDNAANNPKGAARSRALVLSFDSRRRTVSLTHSYVHPAAFLSETLGSVQLLPDRVFVGWGSQSYFSEFDSGGHLLSDGELPISVRSYRAFLADWVGRPSDRPAVVAQANPAGGFAVHASWNGATEIDRWTVLAGAHRDSLEPVGTQRWTGFETAIAVNSSGPFFAVSAVAADGTELGRSEVA